MFAIIRSSIIKFMLVIMLISALKSIPGALSFDLYIVSG